MRIFSCSFAGLHSLHIHDATIEYSNKPLSIVASQTCSTVRLSKLRFIVNSGVEMHLYSPGQLKDQHHLFVALGQKSTLSMDDCVLETTFDCPSLSSLVACTATQGGKVSHREPGAARSVTMGMLLLTAQCPMFFAVKALHKPI
jgi:hypothetical protein